MRAQWLFNNNTPSNGDRPPFFDAGFHVGVITRVEDYVSKADKDKNPNAPSSGFRVHVGNHPTRGTPGQENREGSSMYQYGEKGNAFVMGLLMATFGMTIEQLRANPIDFDPTTPAGQPNSLIGRVVFIETRPNARQDTTDPNKKYDEMVIHFNEAAWNEARQKAAVAAQQASAARGAATQLTGGTTGQQQQQLGAGQQLGGQQQLGAGQQLGGQQQLGAGQQQLGGQQNALGAGQQNGMALGGGTSLGGGTTGLPGMPGIG